MQNHAHFAQCMHVWPFTASQYCTPVWVYAGVDLRTRSACQHQRLKIKLVPGTGGSRPRLAAARCLSLGSHWRGQRPASAAGLDLEPSPKKNLMPIFLPNEQAPTPPPPNEHRSFEKNVDNWRRPLKISPLEFDSKRSTSKNFGNRSIKG